MSRKKQKTQFDHIVNVAAFLGPMTAIPQAYEVFHGGAKNVSLATWMGFMIFNLLFFTYGIYHKLRPIIVTNLLWFVIEGLVVIGILANRIMN